MRDVYSAYHTAVLCAASPRRDNISYEVEPTVALNPASECCVCCVACRAKLFSVAGAPRAAGSIWKGDISTGEGKIVVKDAGGTALGMAYDKRSGYLYVCGGFTGEENLCDTKDVSHVLGRVEVCPPTPIAWATVRAHRLDSAFTVDFNRASLNCTSSLRK